MSAFIGSRAFGGGPLAGSKLVRLVYVDEAGISNPKQEPFAVVAGIIIHADSKLVAVERHLDSLVERHIPAESRDGFIFHATELFNGGGKVFKREPLDTPNPKWPLARRLKIADDLAAIPKRFGLDVVVGWADRATLSSDFELPADIDQSGLAVAAHVVAFIDCSMQIEAWMRRKTDNEVCMLIVEDNERARKVIRDTHLHYQNRRLDVGTSATDVFPFRKIKEEPLFQRKRQSSVLQVADFCAYVFKRILMDDNRYCRFFNPMRQKIVVSAEEQSSRKRARTPRQSRQRPAHERSP